MKAVATSLLVIAAGHPRRGIAHKQHSARESTMLAPGIMTVQHAHKHDTPGSAATAWHKCVLRDAVLACAAAWPRDHHLP